MKKTGIFLLICSIVFGSAFVVFFKIKATEALRIGDKVLKQEALTASINNALYSCTVAIVIGLIGITIFLIGRYKAKNQEQPSQP